MRALQKSAEVIVVRDKPVLNIIFKSVGRMVRQALSVMKIRRYRKSQKICNHLDSEKDTCAICLDEFYFRQVIVTAT